MSAKFLLAIPSKGRDVVKGLLLAIALVALLNFIWVLCETVKVASSAGTYSSPGGYRMTLCYLGPSFDFYLRPLILLALIISIIGFYTKKLLGLLISLFGLFSVIWIYAHWWAKSFIIFENFRRVNASEFRGLAYLYSANWWDICIAIATVLLIVLEVALLIRNPKFEQRFS